MKEKVVCLKCGKKFLSWDRKLNRLCKECKRAIITGGLDQGLEENSLYPIRQPT